MKTASVFVALLIVFGICLVAAVGCISSAPREDDRSDQEDDDDDDNDNDNDDVDAGSDTDTDTDSDSDTDDDNDTDTGAYKKMWDCLICG